MSRILEYRRKIAEEVINQKIEAPGGSAGHAFETAIVDVTDELQTQQQMVPSLKP